MSRLLSNGFLPLNRLLPDMEIVSSIPSFNNKNMVLVLAIGHGKRRVILHLIDGTILFDLLAICVGLTIFLIKSCLGWIGLYWL
jgi:hypothetical protein